jgi:hypothetical protein
MQCNEINLGPLSRYLISPGNSGDRKFWGQDSESSCFYCLSAFGIGANSIGTQA